MSTAAADIFRQAAAANKADPRRDGNVVNLPAGPAIICGDMHGYRAALNKVIGRASAAGQPRQLVLQEIIHGPPDERTGQDRSVELLLRAARLKISHSEQVAFLMGNHDLAQATGNEITKDGRGVCKVFTAGVEAAYGQDAADVMDAIREFLLSMPLAVRCPNGVFISHSLPSPARMGAAGVDILKRPYEERDLRRGGAVYEWTWGRGQTAEQLEQLAATLGVEYFILGHRHVEAGCEVISPRGVTISTEHEHGYVIELDAGLPFGADDLASGLKPIMVLA
ncbi:MAG: metallophosphoesterase [Phycisphaerae bacterium]